MIILFSLWGRIANLLYPLREHIRSDGVFRITKSTNNRINPLAILNTTITLKRLKQRGYQSLTEVYIELNPSLCEPSRSGRDGVRGALRQFLAEPSTRLANRFYFSTELSEKYLILQI